MIRVTLPPDGGLDDFSPRYGGHSHPGDWRPQRLVAEVDSYGFHRTRARFEADRRRDARLLVDGYRVLRVTQQRIEQEPWRVISELRALLGVAAGGR